MVRLNEDTFSRGLETVRTLLGHPRFSSALAAEIRRKGGADRAVDALLREFQKEGPFTIDLDVDPFIPKGWEFRAEDQLDSRVRGTITFDPDRIELHLDPGQKDGQSIQGNELRKALEGQPVLPAHILDFLLENPHLIPESWKSKAVFFWGTIYRDSNGYLCVRCLDWDGERWDWRYYWLDYQWDSSAPAALFAS